MGMGMGMGPRQGMMGGGGGGMMGGGSGMMGGGGGGMDGDRTGKQPDWVCGDCANKNFGWRQFCNRCKVWGMARPRSTCWVSVALGFVSTIARPWPRAAAL